MRNNEVAFEDGSSGWGLGVTGAAAPLEPSLVVHVYSYLHGAWHLGLVHINFNGKEMLSRKVSGTCQGLEILGVMTHMYLSSSWSHLSMQESLH
jgi:hypothetical protein